jgi:diguanylate cyclase (GGDEF)-like protein/PAS domain S-box-containing protein
MLDQGTTLGVSVAKKRSPLRSLQHPATLNALVERLQEGIYITTRTGVILDANPAFFKMLGVASLAELRRYRASDLLVDPEQRRRQLEVLQEHGSVRDFELAIRRPDGEIRHVLDTAYGLVDPETRETLYHGILVDITRHKQLEAELREQAIRDPLTGCFNRHHLAALAAELDHSDGAWGTIVIDVDHFKRYNDSFGHQAGDQVLVQISRFLMRQVRSEDAVIRLGGDEFLLFLRDADGETTEEVSGRLKSSGRRTAPVSFSLGFSVREGDETLEKTIGRADRNLIRVRVEERRFERPRRG